MICYYFYKNIVLVLTEFYFALFNGFSGQIFFLDWLPMLYNAVFTSWHCLFTLLLEKDVNFNYSFRFPEIYKSGQLCHYFNYGVFWRWILLGVWHGGVCFYLPMYDGRRASNLEGTRDDHWAASTISFSMIVHLVTYKLLLETRHFNLISFVFGFLSLLIYWSFLLFASVPFVANSLQPQIQGVIYQMFFSADFWIMIIAGPLVCLIPDAFIQLIKQVFYPTPIDKVLFVQKFKEPNYDYIEHFNNIQKSLQMRKRRTAIQSEQRKIMIAQKRS
jgi:magnesium-transporting ATPase (P-type)